MGIATSGCKAGFDGVGVFADGFDIKHGGGVIAYIVDFETTNLTNFTNLAWVEHSFFDREICEMRERRLGLILHF